MPRAPSLLDTVFDAVATPHRDGYLPIAGVGAMALAALVLGWPVLGIVLLAATAIVAYAFRDPDRMVPLREGLVLAPADGAITAVETVSPPAELGLGADERVRITISPGPLDVHMMRAPVAGRITRAAHVPGAFLDPAAPGAAQVNERRASVIATPKGAEVGVVHLASRFTRRIRTLAGQGDSVVAGGRWAVMRPGSRVDVYLPPGKGSHVAIGQRVTAGETVLGDLDRDEPSREARRV